jgi:hypothetical protein
MSSSKKVPGCSVRKLFIYNLKELPILQLDEKTNKKIQPLDIISFQGADIASSLIGVATTLDSGNADFSHTGMVVNGELIPELKEVLGGKLGIWESTNSRSFGNVIRPVPVDMITGTGRLGSQVRLLETVVADYLLQPGQKNVHIFNDPEVPRELVLAHKSYVCWSKLHKNPWRRRKNESRETLVMRREHVRIKFNLIFGVLRDSVYELNIPLLISAVGPVGEITGNLINSLNPCKRIASGTELLIVTKAGETEADVEFEFCSEMVFRALSFLGLVPDDIAPSKITPVEFFGSATQGLDTVVSSLSYIIPKNIRIEWFQERLSNDPEPEFKPRVRKYGKRKEDHTGLKNRLRRFV